MALHDRTKALRNRLVANPSFRKLAQKIPFFHRFAANNAGKLFAICAGFIHSQVLKACAEAGFFESLAGGPRPLCELAEASAIPRERLDALVRAAAALDLLARRSDGRVALGDLGAALCENPGVIAMIRHHDALYADLGDALGFFRSPASEGRLRNYWSYGQGLASDEAATRAVAPYTRLMSLSNEAVAEQFFAAADLAGVTRLLDVGGGDGSFAIALARRYPSLRIGLVDLPAVAALARQKVDEAGLTDRIETIGADLRRAELPGGYDAVSCVRILHDHDDETVRGLLAAAAAALAPGGRLFVVEPLSERTAAGALLEAYFSVYLLAMGQGRLRSFKELAGWLRAAGLDSVRRLRTPIPLIASVLEASGASNSH